MNDRLWKKFENTGSVEDYLAYKRVSFKETDTYGEDASNGDCLIGDTNK